MGKGPAYTLPFRRRREGKTDYRQRRALVVSNLPRLVVRKSHNHFNVQIIEAKIHGDNVIVSAHSNELIKNFGWKVKGGNTPTAYLTGLLCGLKALTKNVKKAVLDIGLHSPTKGASVFAALRGALDAGMEISYSEEKLPEESRIKGEHIAEYAKQLSTDPEKYQKQFSYYLKINFSPENITKHFDEVKKKILTAFQTTTRAKKRKEKEEEKSK
jgi:large subunit ribosomal protein L18